MGVYLLSGLSCPPCLLVGLVVRPVSRSVDGCVVTMLPIEALVINTIVTVHINNRVEMTFLNNVFLNNLDINISVQRQNLKDLG